MSLLEPLPETLEKTLKAQNGAGAPVIAVATDLTHQGAFGEEWLVVTDEHLRVFPVNGKQPVARLEMPLKSIKSPATEGLIGGGALLAHVQGSSVEILRFTNANQRKFGRVAKYLGDVAKYNDDLAKGKEVKEKPKLAEDKDEPRRCPKCKLLLQEGSKVCPACVNKSKVLLRLIGYLKPYWGMATVVSATMFVGIGLNLVSPQVNRLLFDWVLTPKQPVPDAERKHLLLVLVFAMFGLAALSQGIQMIRARVLVRLGTQLTHDLRTGLYQHMQMLSLKFFDKRQVGSMLTRVTQDTQALEHVLVDGVQYFVVHILTLIGIGIVLFWMNWKLTLLILIPVPIVMLLSRLFWKRVISLWQRHWHFRTRLTTSVNDSLSGVRVVKAFAKESVEIERFRERSNDVRIADQTAEQTWMTFFPMLFFITGMGTYIVWIYGGSDVLGGQMTIGELSAFLAYLGMFYNPLQFLNRIADYLARSLASAERVFEILDTVSEVREAQEAVPMPRIDGRVEFKNVTFGYDQHKPVLKGVDLDIKAGEMIGLVGQSGAGKSTTINLICRFYEVNEGEIRIDGEDIRKIRQQDLRSQIGVVLQDTFLFNGTIAENIGYARPGASLEDIMAAAKAANAHDFIVAKQDGYDTKVGERGQQLSGGERQRISIARAILHNPRILILDEATASVDTDTEKQIQEAVARLVKGRTTFAIAHRLSTLRNANRLVVLKDGKVAEVGTHAELLSKKNGEFARLVGMQEEMSKIVQVG